MNTEQLTEKEKMTVLVVEHMKKPYIKEIDSGLESLQYEVGGYIQVVYPWDDPCAIVCDDEAKLKGKELNRVLRDEDGEIYDAVAGTFLIVGLSEDDFTSLTDEQIQQFSEKFTVPEIFLQVGQVILMLPLDDFDDGED